LKSPSLGASRPVSACADTIGAGKVGEGRPSAWPKKVTSVIACSGRLKSPSLGASRPVSACADTIGAGKVGEGRLGLAQKGDFSHRLFRPIEIALFGRFAPRVGLRRHPAGKVGEGRPLAWPKKVTSVTA